MPATPSPSPSRRTSSPALGTTFRITLNPGSQTTLGLDEGVPQVPVSGTLRGWAPGPQMLAPMRLIVTGGEIDVRSSPLMLDRLCSGQQSSPTRTSRYTKLLVANDGGTLAVSRDGQVHGTLPFALETSLELRDGNDGCHAPYITTGYTSVGLLVTLDGALQGGHLTLRSPIAPVDDLEICISPGDPRLPCSGYEIPLPLSFGLQLDATLGPRS